MYQDLIAFLIKLILFIPMALFLPGYLTRLWLVVPSVSVSSSVESDGCSSQFGDDWLSILFSSVFASALLTGWLGCVLAEIGLFSLPLLLGLDTLYVVLLGLALWRRGGPWRVSVAQPGLVTWLLLIVLLLGVILFFRPHEMILGGSDAGVYVNLGASIAKSGSLLIRDPDLAELSSSLYPDLFREQPPYAEARYLLLPGFYLSNDQPGLIIPQFYPLHSVWQAIFYTVGGLRFSLYAVSLWGLLGCLTVFLTVRQLFGPWAGLLAAALLTLTATQIWFARYPTSEALTQFVLWGGLYCLIRTLGSVTAPESAWDGLLAGTALGQVMLARLDFYFLVLIPLACLAFWRLKRQLCWRRLAFLAPLGLLTVHSLLHGWFQSRPYLVDIYRWGILTVPVPWPILGGAAALALAGFVVLDRRPEWFTRLRPWWRGGTAVLAGVVVLLALYAYFLWPQVAQADQFADYWYGSSQIPDVQPFNLVRIGWYLSPLGLALAVGGIGWLLLGDVDERRTLFLGVGLFFSLLYIQHNRNNPFHIYVMRRYVPVVIPFFVATGAYLLTRLMAMCRGLRVVGIVLTLAQVALLLTVDRFFVPPVDNRGAIEQVSALAAAIGSPSVILFNDDQPVGTAGLLGTPLRFLFGHTVYDLQEQELDGEALTAQVERWQAGGRRVLLAVGPSGVRAPFDDWPLSPLTHVWFDLPVLETSYHRMPRQVVRHQYSLSLYEVGRAQARAAEPDLTVDVGGADFFYVGTGWHGPERLDDDTTVRWTTADATLTLPDRSLVTAAPQVMIQVRMSSGERPGGEPVPVVLRADGSEVARWQVTSGFALYHTTFRTDGDLDTLRFMCEPWSPAADGLSNDTRRLGVLVDWVKAEDGEN